MTDIAAHFQQTDLHSLFEEHHGTPIVLDFDYYSCLVRCIIHQQLNLAFAHKLTERYVQTFGEKMDGVWFFPTPERAAQLTVAELRDLQFSTRKAEYLIGLSEQVASGQLAVRKISIAIRSRYYGYTDKGSRNWQMDGRKLFTIWFRASEPIPKSRYRHSKCHKEII